jgi:hypothetical protein
MTLQELIEEIKAKVIADVRADEHTLETGFKAFEDHLKGLFSNAKVSASTEVAAVKADVKEAGAAVASDVNQAAGQMQQAVAGAAAGAAEGEVMKAIGDLESRT